MPSFRPPSSTPSRSPPRQHSNVLLDGQSQGTENHDDSASPIARLPPELLAPVFAFSARLDAFAPLALSSVCRLWRAVVLTWPIIWCSIVLDETGSRALPALQTQAAMWATRSAPLDFDVRVQLRTIDGLLPLLVRLLPHVHRWRRCEIAKGKWEEVAEVAEMRGRLFTLNRPPPEDVDQLEINVVNEAAEEEEVDNGLGRSVERTFYVDEASLFTLNVSVTSLPDPRLIGPLRFSCLVIRELAFDLVIPPFQLLNLLTALPCLVCLTVHSTATEPVQSDIRMPTPHLPRLHALVLRSSCSTRFILPNLNAPNLSELYLEHLNVSARLYNEYAYESGDSDDEAGDFSQSPYSDHATGMALRGLIRRCNPPLRVLDMNYADMRTKDFQWCFERLKSLEYFRIVASDMSDKVIGFLAPFEDEGTLRVRLPRLNKLELYNCQAWSGDAMVGALRARVEFTDGRHDHDADLETLERVAIVQCSNFLHEHGQALGGLLRSRLFIS